MNNLQWLARTCLLLWRFVSRVPDVHQGHGRVESVEDTEGEGDMADYAPLKGPIEFNFSKLIKGRLLHEDVEYIVHKISNNKKHESISSRKIFQVL